MAFEERVGIGHREEADLKIAMLSVHSSPVGELGTKHTGGMSVYVRELARELGLLGHRVDIFTLLDGAPELFEFSLSRNVRLIHLDCRVSGNMQKSALSPCIDALCRALDDYAASAKSAYDLIHSHYWLSGLLGLRAQRRWKVPHVLMFHTLGAVKNETGVGEPESELRIAAEKELANACHRVFVPTQIEKKNLMNLYGVSVGRIGVVPCGVDLDLFQPMEKASARRRIGLDPDSTILLYVGRFDPMKGIERLLAAMTFLKHRKNLRLVLVGGDGRNSPEFQRLKELARAMGVQEAVSFAGRIDQTDLPPYYCAADALIVPSFYESFGLVGLESLACGTPVISTRVGFLAEMLKKNGIGWFVENGTPQSLAVGIDALSTILQTRESSAESIRSAVLGFRWSVVASAIVEEYKKLL